MFRATTVSANLAQLWRRDTAPTELFSAVLAVLAAVIFFLPGNTLAGPAYRHFADIAPEYGWAICFLSQGFFQLMAVTIGTVRLQRLACILSCAIWGLATILFVLSNPFSIAAVFFGMLTLWNAWAAIVIRP